MLSRNPNCGTYSSFFSNLSSAVFNKWIVTNINPYFFFITPDGSNGIKLTWSEMQVEYYTIDNFLECHQDADHTKILNRRRSVSLILPILIDVDVC